MITYGRHVCMLNMAFYNATVATCKFATPPLEVCGNLKGGKKGRNTSRVVYQIPGLSGVITSPFLIEPNVYGTEYVKSQNGELLRSWDVNRNTYVTCMYLPTEYIRAVRSICRTADMRQVVL